MTATETDPRTEEVALVERDAMTLAGEARTFTVNSAATNEAAARFLRERVKAVRTKINETFDPIIESAHRAHRMALDQKKSVDAPLADAERIVKGAMGAYAMKVREEQAAEQRRIDAERQRIAQEQARADAEARRIAEDARLAEAVKLAEAGKAAAADALMHAPAPVVVAAPVAPQPVPVYVAPPKAAGTTTRFVWKYRITDAALIGRDFLVPNDAEIGREVRRLGAAAAAAIGGIECFEEAVVGARA